MLAVDTTGGNGEDAPIDPLMGETPLTDVPRLAGPWLGIRTGDDAETPNTA